VKSTYIFHLSLSLEPIALLFILFHGKVEKSTLTKMGINFTPLSLDRPSRQILQHNMLERDWLRLQQQTDWV
jgi:hypothetical protein